MDRVKELINEGSTLAMKGEFRAAEIEYLRALQLEPDNPIILSNLVKIRLAQKRFDGALTYHQYLIQVKPHDVDELSEALLLAEMRCSWEYVEKWVPLFRKELNELPSLRTESFLMIVPHTFQELYEWTKKRALGDEKLQEILSQKSFDHSEHKVGKKIKVGYFMTELGPYPCGLVMKTFLENHNHEDFEWHCFCFKDLSKENGDWERELVNQEVNCFDYFHDMSNIDDEKQIAQKIYDEKMDIIVDINMLGNKKWRALAYKPAPIIVGFLGIASTTGLPYYDYLIGDKETIPENQRQFFSEKIMDMPFCYHPADGCFDKAAVHIAKLDLMLPEDKVIYCSFVTPFKITKKYFDSWCRILKSVPNSVLWLRSREDAEEDNLRREAMKRGISPDRIIFLSGINSRSVFLSCFKLADLSLDAEIWQSHSTCLESLSCGVPLLTCTGNSFCSRVPTTMLKVFGLPEMVCENLQEYEQKAIDLGLHPEKLNALKAKTRALKTPNNPLFDMKQYAYHFEENLKKMLHEKGLR